MGKEYSNREELLKTAKKALHISFGELDKTNRLHSVKGGIGQVAEESAFGYSINSDSEPDIPNLGVDIKTAGVIKNKSGEYRAKERLVLNIINYMTENLESFEDSHFWHKNKELLIMFYEYLKDGTPKTFWEFFNYIDYRWPEEDLLIVKQDWETIVKKIREGKAHELSESDTMYLGACTKGATAETSLRKQPYSNIEAKQRAYSLKQSYMSYLVNEYLFGNKQSEKIITSNSELTTKTFDEIIFDRVKPYIGKTQKELVYLLGVTPSKQTNASIINKIFKLSGDIANTEEFQKANIIPKTVRIEANGTIKEHMSFPVFKFKEIINQTFEESDFGYTLSTGRFMFAIFQKVDDTEKNSIFKGIKFWRMPYEDLIEAQRCWETTKHIVAEGVKLDPISNGFSNNLPGAKDNRISHVRPHASKSYYKFGNTYEKGNPSDGDELPDGRWMTKQCFWLNKEYIKSILEIEG